MAPSGTACRMCEIGTRARGPSRLGTLGRLGFRPFFGRCRHWSCQNSYISDSETGVRFKFYGRRGTGLQFDV